MFNLDDAVIRWRKQLVDGGIIATECLDELESHLRDDVERQMAKGLDAEQAFMAACTRIGQPGALRTEFRKRVKMKTAMQTVKALLLTPLWEWHFSSAQVKRVALTFAGIPDERATINGPGAILEPRWATYARTGALFGPALFLWVVAGVIVAPKLREVCIKSGLQQDVDPQFFAGLDAMVLLQEHWFSITVVTAAALTLLEWRSRRWPRYRRAVLGAGAVLLNFTALLFIFFMGIIAVLAASRPIDWTR